MTKTIQETMEEILEWPCWEYGDIKYAIGQLKKFVALGAAPEHWRIYVGLCSNCELGAIDYLFPYWDKYSGDESYPISGEDVYYDRTIDKYSGEQLELRLDLAKFIIKCFEEYHNG